MLATLMAACLFGAAVTQQTDTTFTVPANARLVVHGVRGEVTVRAWDRREVRVQAEGREDGRVEVAVTNGRVRVETSGRYGVSYNTDLTVTVPATMPVEIEGTMVDADLAGLRAEVRVDATQGDISLQGGSRYVRLHSMNGHITVADASGRITLSSTNGTIRGRNLEGEITAGTVNGDVILERVTSDLVEIGTTNGDVTYDGTLTPDGQYVIGTHGGDVTLVVPARTSATISVSSFSGEVESEFPLTLRGTEAGGNKFTFTLGAGEGRIEVGSFSGTIYLRRP
jgi:DUF4097 and DUF4098 domain-containing protein YvlB